MPSLRHEPGAGAEDRRRWKAPPVRSGAPVHPASGDDRRAVSGSSPDGASLVPHLGKRRPDQVEGRSAQFGRQPHLDQQQLARVDMALHEGPGPTGSPQILNLAASSATVIVAAHRSAYHPGICLLSLRRPRLVAPAPRSPCTGARRRGHSADQSRSADRGRKNARASAPGSSSTTKAGISPVPRRPPHLGAPRQDAHPRRIPSNWQRSHGYWRWPSAGMRQRPPRFLPGNPRQTYRTASLIGFLRHLRRHFRRQRMILLSMACRSARVPDAHVPRLVNITGSARRALAGYAPDSS